jgi:subtilase family serine protease
MRRITALIAAIFMICLSFTYVANASQQSYSSQVIIPQIQSSANSSASIELYSPTSSVSDFLSVYRELAPLGITVLNYGYFIQLLGRHGSIVNNSQEILSLEDTLSLTPIENNFLYYPLLNFSSVNSNNFPLLPSQIATAYSFGWDYQHGINGRNETIAVVDAYGDPQLSYDVKAFDYATNLPPINLQVIYQNKTPMAYNYSWAVETSLDVEWAHAMAPLAKILLVLSPDASNGLDNGISYVVKNRLANVISISWGSYENPSQNAAMLSAMNQVFYNATLDNITVVAASGDQGAYDGTSGPALNFPASDPYVLAVGGTSLGLFNGVFSQAAWGGFSKGTTFGSGGGFSSYFRVPSWQRLMIKNSTSRGVPDVSLDADPQTGVEIISQGNSMFVGGTSLSTPVWAAIIALMDQFNDRSLGLVSPMLYFIASTGYYTQAFTQITSGNNGYYYAYAGWNPVTGLGTPIVSNLLNISREITQPYGTVVEVSGNGFNYSTVSANLSVAVMNNSILFGTDYYFLSFYSNPGNFLKFGIELYGKNASYGFIGESDGIFYQNFQRLAYSGNYISLSLTIHRNGSRYYGTAANYRMDLNAYFAQDGQFNDSLGAEVINPQGNFTAIPSASFSGVVLSAGDLRAVPQSYLEQGFSGLGPGFNTVSISYGNGFLNTSYSTKPPDTYILGSAPSTGVIMFNSEFSPHPSYTFFVPGYSGTAFTWSVNSTGSSVTGNVIHFGAPGRYEITASSQSITLYRNITVPDVEYIKSDFINPVSGFRANVNAVVDYFQYYSFSLTGSNNLSIPYFVGQNNVMVSAHGYHLLFANVSAGSQLVLNFSLNPYPSNLSLDVFPAAANLRIDGSFYQRVGDSVIHVNPGNRSFNLSLSNFNNFSREYFFDPGTNYTIQITLNPLNRSIIRLSGNVTDFTFGFPLSGVNVSSTFSYAYTTSSGFFVVFLKPGYSTVNFTYPQYDTYRISSSFSANLSENITMNFMGIYNNLVVKISRSFSLLFSVYYISWGYNFNAGNISYLEIFYSSSPSFDSPHMIKVPAGTTSQIITMIPNVSTYYFKVVAFLSNGYLTTSSNVEIQNGNYVSVFANLAIIAAIVIYFSYIVILLKRKRSPPKNFFD